MAPTIHSYCRGHESTGEDVSKVAAAGAHGRAVSRLGTSVSDSRDVRAGQRAVAPTPIRTHYITGISGTKRLIFPVSGIRSR
jgi:hypothetical protein